MNSLGFASAVLLTYSRRYDPDFAAQVDTRFHKDVSAAHIPHMLNLHFLPSLTILYAYSKIQE